MDLNEIKNRAKDLLAELTEQRSERSGRPAAADRSGGADDGERHPVRDGAGDRVDRAEPATRPGETGAGATDATGREPVAASTAEPERAWTEPTGTVRGEPGRHRDRTESMGSGERTAGPGERVERMGSDERVDPVRSGEQVGKGERVEQVRSDERVEPVRSDERVGQVRSGERVEQVDLRDRDLPAGPRDRAEPGAPDRDSRAPHQHPAEPAAAPTARLPVEPERMVSAERAESYSSRWEEVRGDFVDEPRRAVAQADALVGELLDELTQLFRKQRSSIEQDFDRDEVSTEDLRLALRRYRSFFDRLLTV